MKNLGVTPYRETNYLVRRSWNRPTAASAHTTSTHGSCASASSSSHAGGRHVANLVCAQLLFLESEEPTRTSTSTSTRPAARYGALRHLRHHEVHPRDVSTFCFGQRRQPPLCCCLGTRGKRFALPTPASCCTSPSRRRGPGERHRAPGQEILRMRDMPPGCSPRTRASRSRGVEGHRPRLHHDRGRGGAYGVIDEFITPGAIPRPRGSGRRLSLRTAGTRATGPNRANDSEGANVRSSVRRRPSEVQLLRKVAEQVRS